MNAIVMPFPIVGYDEQSSRTIQLSHTGGLSFTKDVAEEAEFAQEDIERITSASENSQAGLLTTIYNLVLRALAEPDYSEEETIQLDAVPQFIELLERPMFKKFEAPEISIDPDGEINAEWLSEKGRSFTFSLNDTGRIIFSLYIPEGRRLCGETRIDDDLDTFEDYILAVMG